MIIPGIIRDFATTLLFTGFSYDIARIEILSVRTKVMLGFVLGCFFSLINLLYAVEELAALHP